MFPTIEHRRWAQNIPGSKDLKIIKSNLKRSLPLLYLTKTKQRKTEEEEEEIMRSILSNHHHLDFAFYDLFFFFVFYPLPCISSLLFFFIYARKRKGKLLLSLTSLFSSFLIQSLVTKQDIKNICIFFCRFPSCIHFKFPMR